MGTRHCSDPGPLDNGSVRRMSDTTEQHRDFEGHIDGCDGLVVHGWACDTSTLDIPIVLDVVVDDEIVLRILADRFRPDLKAKGYGNGRHGFFALLPDTICDGRRHAISVRPTGSIDCLHGGTSELQLSSEFCSTVQLLLATRAELQHGIAVNELMLLNEGRRESGRYFNALDLEFATTYTHIIANWPTTIFREQE